MKKYKYSADDIKMPKVIIPSWSTSVTMFLSSDSVGLWPKDLITIPNSSSVILPSKSLSNRLKASLNSAICSSVRPYSSWWCHFASQFRDSDGVHVMFKKIKSESIAFGECKRTVFCRSSKGNIKSLIKTWFVFSPYIPSMRQESWWRRWCQEWLKTLMILFFDTRESDNDSNSRDEHSRKRKRLRAEVETKAIKCWWCRRRQCNVKRQWMSMSCLSGKNCRSNSSQSRVMMMTQLILSWTDLTDLDAPLFSDSSWL